MGWEPLGDPMGGEPSGTPRDPMGGEPLGAQGTQLEGDPWNPLIFRSPNGTICHICWADYEYLQFPAFLCFSQQIRYVIAILLFVFKQTNSSIERTFFSLFCSVNEMCQMHWIKMTISEIKIFFFTFRFGS